jgi:transcription antitermination factor NusG
MRLMEMRPQMGNATGAPTWHAVFTRHQHEKIVASSLSKKSYEVYLPLYHSLRQWQDRAKFLWLPLFPCYVFVRGGMDRPLQILTTHGVVQIVRWGGHPAIVPETQIDAVRRVLDSGLTVECHPYLQVGDRVRVKAGPLTGLEGILARRKGAARLVVSMEILSRSAAVEIEEWNLERIGPLSSLQIRNQRLAVSA